MGRVAESGLEGDGRQEGGTGVAGFLEDEMGANTSLSVMRAWSRTGERVYCTVARNRGKNTTFLLASMGASGMGPTLAVEDATDREVFEAYVEEVLAKSLRLGQLVVMDNLLSPQGRWRTRTHRRAGLLRAAVHASSYLPDLKWDEKAEITLR